MNESIFNAGILRNQGEDVRQEDKLNTDERNYVQKLMDEFANDSTRIDDWETQYTLDDFLDYAKLNAEDDGYDWGKIKTYIQSNWTTGRQICDYVNPQSEEDKVDESIFNAGIKRNQGEDQRQEDKLSENDKKALDNYIGMFCSNICFDGDYDNTLDDFIAFIKDNANHMDIEKLNPDIIKIVQYVKDNWVDEICDEIDDEIDTIERTNESIFNAGIKRNQGEDIKKEDDINLMDRKEFCEYLESMYEKTEVWGINNTFPREIQIPYNNIKDNKGETFVNSTIKAHYDENNLKLDMILMPKSNASAYLEGTDFEMNDIHDYNTQFCKITKNGETSYNVLLELLDYLLSKSKNPALIKRNVNESIFNAGIKRNQGEDLRQEDKLNPINLKVLKKYIEHFLDPDGFDGFYGEYSNTWKGRRKNQFINYLRKYGNIFQYMSEYEGYSMKDIINYVETNWNIVEQMMSKMGMGVDESIFNAGIKRNQGEEVRQEDKLDEQDKVVLYNVINMFRHACKYGDTYTISLSEFERYLDCLDKDGFKRWNKEKIVKYVRNNWDKGDNLENKIKNVNECDVAAPNYGITFSDISGMGPILFPGECGEMGSGDLPMPSGKVYQQVAPFTKFIKMKKNKKKKKFDKKDEPCAKYTNPPIYSHVDDFRDYVNRTYDIVDRK